MLIYKRSQITGKMNSMHINVTKRPLDEYLTSGRCIQDVLPQLTADEREFILTGVTPEEWNAAFPEEE